MSGAVAGISYRGTQSWTYGANGSVGTGINPTVGFPASIAANDLLIFGGITNNTKTISTPSGFTTLVASDNGLGYFKIAYKIATGSESGSVVLTASDASTIGLIMNFTPNIKDASSWSVSSASTNGTPANLDSTKREALYFSMHCSFGSAGTSLGISNSTIRYTRNDNGVIGAVIMSTTTIPDISSTISRTATKNAGASWIGSIAAVFQ